jgi:hypothetical protein
MPPWICTAWCAQNIAVSDANSFATEPSVVLRPPCFFVSILFHAARSVSRRAASRRHFMSASFCWIIWKLPIALPKALRSFA